MRFSPPRALVAALVALLVPLVLSASAHAFSLTSVGATPGRPANSPLGASDPAVRDPLSAAAHPDMAIRLDFDDVGNPTADSVDSLEIGLAPGIVAFVNHIETCTTWDMSQTRTNCPRSVIGSAITRASAPVLGALTLNGAIYRIPSPDPSRVPTAFGIDIEPPLPGLRRIKLVSPITVNPLNLGLTASLSGLPNFAEVPLVGRLPVHIDSITQILNGYNAEGRSFFTNPTSCIPAVVSVTARSHGGAPTSGNGSYTPTDCENVPFNTTLASSADPNTADSTSAISTDVIPGTEDIPRVSSMVRGTTFLGAPGMLLNPALAARLDACTDAGFALADSSVAANCPASSEVGTIDFTSPILGNFPGKAYFGTQTPTDRLRLFLDVPLFGAHIKLSGTVNPDFRTGQITLKFSDLPQVAFTNFRLTFKGGPQSALVTPTTCGPATTIATVTPWSGGAARTPSASYDVVDCARRFTPSMATSVSNPQAGADTSFTLSFDRPDRTVPVGRVAFDLPPGLIGSLALPGLTKCALATAAANACPASSRIGSVNAIVGSGTEPPTLPGSIYLTEPRVAGDPAGLSISVPARLGPVDAGIVTVAQRLTLGNDGGLDIVSDPIPALQLGIPLAIRRLTVNVDRAGFMKNPTSCGTPKASGAFSPLDGGAGATASSTITVNGCDRLPFGPRITGTIGGRGQNREGQHPSFTTRITQRAGESAMKTAVVTLPRAVSTNLPTLRAACPLATYNARRCTARTIVATATAVSPLINRPITGPTYLVRTASGGLPSLAVELRGEVSLDLLGTNAVRGGLVITTFGSIPDLPLSSFELRFRGGREGVLTTVGDLCARPVLGARFTSQSGRATSQSPRLTALGCVPRPKSGATLRFRRGAGRLGVRTGVARSGKPLSSVRIGLPRGLLIRGASVTSKAGRTRLARRAIRVSGRTITVKLSRRGARKVTVNVRGVRASSARLARRLAARRGRLTVTVRTAQKGGPRVTQKVKLKLR
ncbi:hypothetical protein [Conexibacter woesei]|uniref:Uncharacterized protein n=1 Tax=Conexibacter woesei (strain DSM 14684 / CCUG 47730 / CIP 108061 / JCM 11494 / NBRC 100937 / ID131577) TaxID=469383 RepID=D3F0J7_CONWI|nr:hypothetical protein [Conexibacter woesei]ADB53931.1 hypothetical protein Cwoe_5526 [Conexibacter woesei DSM 14684]